MWNSISIAIVSLAQDTPTAFGGNEGPDFTRYMTLCALLILAIGGLAYGFKRVVGGNMKTRASKRSLQVLDVLPLGGKQRLAVVRCYDRTFAIGLGDKEVTAIAELDPMIGANEVQHDATPADEQTFQNALDHVQRALADNRSGVGAAVPTRSGKCRKAIADLIGGAQKRRAVQPVAVAQSAPAAQVAQPVAATQTASAAQVQVAARVKAKVQAQAKAHAQALAAARAELETQAAAHAQALAEARAQTASAAKQPRRKAKPAAKAKRRPQPQTTAAATAAAPARKPRRKAKAQSAAQAPTIQTLGLEGVMG